MKIALFGATGRLGRAIAAMAAGEKDLEIKEAIAHPRSASLGALVAGIPVTPIYQGPADLLIDATLAKVFPLALETARLAKKPIVIGVTGLSDAELEQLRAAAKEIPVFYTTNFSLGMAIFRRLSVEAARRFYPSSTADLFEAHHAQKKDAPSGSALTLSKELQKISKNANIHSIRSGKIVGEHSLLLNCDEERIEIAHTVHSRDAFARGALAAARFLIDRKSGLYGMDDLLV
jgi:4-hydroxy-tetrahydrodipicolinate reductase